MLLPNVNISGTGHYLPEQIKTSEEMDIDLGKPKGFIRRLSRINKRHYASNETTAEMAGYAAIRAIEDAGITPYDISCIVGASAIPQQLLPGTSPFIQRALGLEKTGIPCFDVNASCLSHLAAIDLIAPHVASGRYNNVLVVSSEFGSKGINKNSLESYVLFGDGAAATIISRDPEKKSGIIFSEMKTYSEFAELSEIVGGGTKMPGYTFNENNQDEFYFKMDGPKIKRSALEILPNFIKETFTKANMTMDDVDMIIPHQASYQSLEASKRLLNIPDSKMINIVSEYGNMISASIPFALDYAIKNEKIKKGDNVLFLGTAAGLSIGATLIKY